MYAVPECRRSRGSGQGRWGSTWGRRGRPVSKVSAGTARRVRHVRAGADRGARAAHVLGRPAPGHRPSAEEDPLNAWMWKCTDRRRGRRPAGRQDGQLQGPHRRRRHADELGLLRPRRLHPRLRRHRRHSRAAGGRHHHRQERHERPERRLRHRRRASGTTVGRSTPTTTST